MENREMDRTQPAAGNLKTNSSVAIARLLWWLGTAIGVAMVLLLATRVAMALTYAGPVTVTANMASFSPNPVEVNSPATANLSANYNPPSGVSEGDLSAQYDWSVANVQYKALQADAFGPAPSGSYTDSISPTQPSTSSNASLTFTPLIAGYWAVSVSCSVTVTDTKTNQYWTGSANAGPEDLTSYTLDITYTGPVVGGGSDSGMVVTNKTTDVHAGWPIQLGVAHVAPADLSKTYTWSIDGAGGNGSAAVGGYNPTSGPTYVTTLDPESSTGVTFPGANEYYYYTIAGSETASVTPTGSGIPPAKTTFAVAKPTAAVSTLTPGVYVWPASGGFGFGQWMFNPPLGLLPGISFSATTGQNTGFSGSSNWIQVYAPDQSYWGANGQLLDTVGGAGLDTLNRNGGVFYGVSPPSDSPNTDPGAVANGPVGKIVVADHATMWFMYKPAAVGSIWIPIDSVNWNWGGTETLSNGAWALTGGTWAQNPGGTATNTFPVWDGYVNHTPTPVP
jgi:hypothetical protein